VERSSGNGIYLGPIPLITELERGLLSLQTLSGSFPPSVVFFPCQVLTVIQPRRMSWADHERHEKKSLENQRERGHLEDLRIDGKITLESVLQE
jgi:hypothetical protein